MTRGAVAVRCAIAGVALSCGGQPPPERAARSASAIESDASDAEHRFAVAVLTTLGPGDEILCSGVLLAPNLVATARHCVAQIDSAEVDCASSKFGATFAPAMVAVTADATVDAPGASFIAVSQIVVPADAGDDAVCGDDLALLVLASSIDLPQYVTPTILPPMTDAALYTARVTAIGYGVTAPTDVDAATARVRRIKEDIPLVCIPNDTSFVDCFVTADLTGAMSAREFLSGDASTCNGDSGSGAFEQSNFDRGRWVAFGVLSRGAVSADGRTCVQPIYTRFDAWGSLLATTAEAAAAQGGYGVPAWALPQADGAPDETNAPLVEGGGGFGCTVVQRSPLGGSGLAFGGSAAWLSIGVAVRRKGRTKKAVTRGTSCREPDITR